MCGIFSILVPATSTVSSGELLRILNRLYLLSESRGREAAGIAAALPGSLHLLKSGLPASRMIRHPHYQALLHRLLPTPRPAPGPLAFIGHSRLVTTGSHFDSANNQPILYRRVIGVHNGIIVNHDDLWTTHPELTRHREIDTEILIALIDRSLRNHHPIPRAIADAFATIEGAASIATLFADYDAAAFATNTGSLYLLRDPLSRILILASEHYIARRLLDDQPLGLTSSDLHIEQLPPGRGLLVSLHDLSLTFFPPDPPPPSLQPPAHPPLPPPPTLRNIYEEEPIAPPPPPKRLLVRAVGLHRPREEQDEREIAQTLQRFPHDPARSNSLRRCTRCILPETMPFITFDDQGVCSYCHTHQPLHFHGPEALRQRADDAIAHSPNPSGPHCVVGVSGGRDSLYSLHLLREHTSLQPVAYTYDWGMVTDLARRNISRVCAKLGIEHIIVSADITTKRENIRKNVAAWLKRPRLGIIPLFMAGDKQYFYHLQQVRKQLGVTLTIMGENRLERTDFKTGFAGVPPFRDPAHVYTLPSSSKLHLASYYGREYLLNPRYLNRSLLDTAFASACYYAIDRDYLNLYGYLPWIEDDIVSTLLHTYKFELAPDTSSTWRIGDGTAAFYNYIYYTVAGFTENDTFRSNQIREGLITRDHALHRIREENQPRWPTILWYLRTIGLDLPLHQVAAIIHSIPPLDPKPNL